MTTRSFRFLASLLLLCAPSLKAEKTVTLGIVIDGPAAQWDDIQSIFISELAALTENEFKVEAPPEKRLDGQWSAEKIGAALDRLEADKSVDAVIALGFAASQQAAGRRAFAKPTFAPFVTNTALAGETKPEGSGIKNLNLLTSESRLGDQLKLFRAVVPFTRLAVLLDETLYQSLPGVIRPAVEKARENGIELSFVTHAGEPDLTAKIPADVQAVMVGPLPRLTPDQRRALVVGLIQRKLPSFSLRGDDEVEEGFLMSDVSAADIRRLARQTGLNIQAVLRGEPASAQVAVFERKAQVTINMATARALNVSPRFTIIREAALINEDEDAGPPLRLSDAAKEALKANLNLAAGRLGVEAGEKEVAQVRSVLLPQLEAAFDMSRRRDDFPIVTRGLAAERTTEASLNFSQLVFSEQALANLAIQERLQIAHQAQQRSLEVDIVYQAATSYLRILAEKTQLDIQRSSLRLAQANWKLAKDRVEVGKADVSDIYRWENEIATARQRMLRARADLDQARDRLNRLLQRPIEDRFPVTPATLDDPSLFTSRSELFQVVDNERAFRLMARFLLAEAMHESPDLAELEARINAQRRRLASERWAWVLPEAALSARGSRVLSEKWAPGSTIRLEDENDWRLGLNVSLPLLEGGGHVARTQQARIILNQLLVQREALAQSIERDLRDGLHALRASHPAIRLSQQAAEAARKTYDLVSRNYARGTRSVVDLLDARNASLAAEQTAANAVYQALADLMGVQRAMGQFDFFLDPAVLDDRLARLKIYIEQAAP